MVTNKVMTTYKLTFIDNSGKKHVVTFNSPQKIKVFREVYKLLDANKKLPFLNSNAVGLREI